MSATHDLTRATVDTGYSRRTGIDDFARIMTRLLDRGINVTQSGSAALGLARVADGRLDGYAERHLATRTTVHTRLNRPRTRAVA